MNAPLPSGFERQAVDAAKEILRLRERIELLEETNRQLLDTLAMPQIFPKAWGLDRGERKILESLYCSPNGFRTNEMLRRACEMSVKSESSRIVNNRVCHLRKKLKPARILIETFCGEGFRLPKESRAIIKAALEREDTVTKLDPVREARARKMVLNPSTWPNSYLPMKRISEPMEFGVILSSDAEPNRIAIVGRGGNEDDLIFGSIDELVEAGWTVD